MNSINVSYDCLPIPFRDFDYCATYDGYDGDNNPKHGFGKTKQEAINNLLEETNNE